MFEQINEEEVLTLNPQIDKAQLQKGHELRGKLRRKGYDLASPLTRRRVTVDRDTAPDSRTVHLGQR